MFAHRGTYCSRHQDVDVEHIWRPRSVDGRRSYRIDRNHALVRDLKAAADEFAVDLESLLKLLEETVPVQQIWLDAAERHDTHSRPFEAAAEHDVVEVMSRVYRALIDVERLRPSEAVARIGAMEPFREHRHLIALLTKTRE